MNAFRTKLMVAGAFVVLFGIGALMNSRGATAAGSAPVTIVGPLPVPVSGSTTVSGTVAATQSGPWSVAQNGAWSVNVASSLLNPVHTIDISQRASQTVHIECEAADPNSVSPLCIAVTPGGANGGAFVVPTGNSFVLTDMDVQTVPGGAGTTTFVLEQGGFAVRQVFTVSNANVLTQLHFNTGMAFQAGDGLRILVYGGAGSPCPTCETTVVNMHGYLTPF